MSGFTPGPWETDRNNVHAGSIATIHHCLNNDWVEVWSPNWPMDEAEQEANARLIAAAPEMLDFLKHAASHLEDGIQECHGAPDEPPQPASEWDYLAGQLVSELRALIAKATGEAA